MKEVRKRKGFIWGFSIQFSTNISSGALIIVSFFKERSVTGLFCDECIEFRPHFNPKQLI